MIHTPKTLPALLLSLALAALPASPAGAGEAVTLTDVHGLSYSADGQQLLVASHNGIAVYANGRWSKAAGPADDYMGFSATRDALYSSGHPAPGSKAINPFGLIKSRDGGKSWQKFGLEGEADFHTLATSHGTNAVYVINHRPNSRMKEAGIYYTLNDGLKWQRADAKGLPAKVNALAVHPSDAKLVAAGADDGLYLSRNSAGSFERLVSGKQVLAASFDLNGDQLWFSAYSSEAALFRMGLKAGAKTEQVKLPALTKDAVAYIAQNPSRHNEIAIGTFRKSVYFSKDQGGAWTQIAKEGATL